MSALKAEDLLGAWSLLTYVKMRDGEIVGYPLSETPRGLLLYTPDGQMGAYLQNGLNPPLVAYGGRWSIRGDVVLHHVSFNSDNERAGTVLERTARFESGDLILQTPRKQTAKGLEWLELRWTRAP
ncbi:MAG: lipocalin-like domain-containing protein [Caulobacterales bacterium]